jgi:hypothetical protein
MWLIDILQQVPFALHSLLIKRNFRHEPKTAHNTSTSPCRNRSASLRDTSIFRLWFIICSEQREPVLTVKALQP